MVNWFKIAKAALGAAVVVVSAFGCWKGYRDVRARISREQQNARALEAARAQGNTQIQTHVDDMGHVVPQATEEFKVAVTEASADPVFAEEVKKAAFRTAFVASEESIAQAAVATGGKTLPATLAKRSFYAAIAAAAGQHTSSAEAWATKISEALAQGMKQALDMGKVAKDTVVRWMASQGQEDLRPFHVPAWDEIAPQVAQGDPVALVQHMVELDDRVAESYRLEHLPPKDSVLIEAEPEIQVEIVPA